MPPTVTTSAPPPPPASDPLETQAGKVQEAQDSDSDSEEGATGGEAEMDFLRNFFSQTLGLGTQKERLLDDLTLEGVTRYMQSERCKSLPCLSPLALLLAPCDFSAATT